MSFVAVRSKRGVARPRQTGTSLFVWLSSSLFHRNFREYFKIAIAALPYLFANRSRQNDASVRSGSGLGFGVSMDEETAATASVGFSSGLQSQHTGAVVARIHRRPGDGPVSARDWANVGQVLHSGIVLPRPSTGIAGCGVLAVLLKLAGRLRVGPGKCLEVDWKVLWIRHV